MYVAPNSTIILLSNVPLDSRYTDTCLFTDKSTQATTFMAYASQTLSAQSYQRVGRNRCRLNVAFNDVYGCNYMMFQNTSFGTKWWYAFISSVEYINNATTEIVYELDCIQNWITDWTLLPCFIERNHVTDDTIGANIIPEPVSGGNRYTGTGVSVMPKGEDTIGTDEIQCYYVFAGYNQDDILPDGGTEITVYQNIARGLSLYRFTSDELSEMNNWLEELTQAGYDDTIVGIYCFYGYYDGVTKGTGGLEPDWALWQLNDTDYDIPFIQDIQGYTPRNNKLFTYPYNCIRIDNANGDSAEYRYEFFGTDSDGDIDPQFRVYGVISCPPEMYCLPYNYLGDTAESYGDGIALRGFPQVAYTIDGFRAWIAQNLVPTTISIASNIFGTAFGALTGGMVAEERTNQAFNRYTSAVNNFQNHPTPANMGRISSASLAYNQAVQNEDFTARLHNVEMANTVSRSILNELEVPISAKQSNAGASSILYAMGFMEFEAFQECISAQMASMIDSYFDRFGYAINDIQTPNINARTHFTYIKTKGCKISGAIPNDDRENISTIFDTGITFWNTLSEVGNYSDTIISDNAI